MLYRNTPNTHPKFVPRIPRIGSMEIDPGTFPARRFSTSKPPNRRGGRFSPGKRVPTSISRIFSVSRSPRFPFPNKPTKLRPNLLVIARYAIRPGGYDKLGLRPDGDFSKTSQRRGGGRGWDWQSQRVDRLELPNPCTFVMLGTYYVCSSYIG